MPVIDGWNRFRRQYRDEELIMMRDGAPGHAAADIKAELEAWGIRIMSWPAFSPDLNPIEKCWNWIKDCIEDHWGLEENPSYDKLRKYVEEAWDALPESYLEELLASIPAGCQAVIEANGMHTKFDICRQF